MAISNDQLLSAVKKYPIVVGCVVLSIASVVGMYIRGNLIPEATVQLEELAKTGKRVATNIKYASELDQQLNAVTAANKEIDARLVRADQLAGNLQYFYELESATGTKLLDLRQLPPGAKGPGKKSFEPVGFAVALAGTYPQLVEFLQRLEGGKHFCRILSISFTPAAKDSNDSLSLGRPESLTVNITLELLGQP